MSSTQTSVQPSPAVARLHFPEVDTHLIRSQHVAQTFQIQVMLPAMTREEDTKFPVVYVTDGNWSFDGLKSISYCMQSSERDSPRFILVGIGYPGACPEAGAMLRGRDFTFPGYPELGIQAPQIEGVLTAEEGTPDFYGAEQFRRFISDELVPFIEARYPALTDDRTYFGHSAGGAFGLFALFSQPRLFQRYIISSPGLIFDGETQTGARYDDHDFVPELARQFIASGRSLPDTHLYMSVGTWEEYEPGTEHWRLTSSFYRMGRVLKAGAIPGLRLTLEEFPRETHMTVWSMAFIHGIQAVFGTGAVAL